MIFIFLLVLSLAAVEYVAAQDQPPELMNFENISRDIHENIFMYYYPKSTVNEKIKIKLEDGLVLATLPNFNTDQTTVFYFHGWGSNVEEQNPVIQALLKKGGQNVVFFDYSLLTRKHKKYDSLLLMPYYYQQSAKNATYIGFAIGQFLEHFIMKAQPKEFIHLISHSLGSHVMSFAAKKFGAGQLWLTGLDPAGPYFDEEGHEHLNASDGSFVDVIHTNVHFLGEKRNVGTVDFYPNGGSNQPGCISRFGGTCSHKRSKEYYAESILKGNAFLAKQCIPFSDGNGYNEPPAAVTYMGLYVDKGAKGAYYLKTNSHLPYGMEEEGLKFKCSELLQVAKDLWK